MLNDEDALEIAIEAMHHDRDERAARKFDITVIPFSRLLLSSLALCALVWAFLEGLFELLDRSGIVRWLAGY